MKFWVTLEESNGIINTLCTDGKQLEGLRGKDKEDILNVSLNCIFDSLVEAKRKTDEFAELLLDCGILDLYKIQIHALIC